MAPGNALADFAAAIIKAGKKAILYFDTQSIAVVSAEQFVDQPGILSCRTANDEDLAVAISALVAVKEVPKSWLEEAAPRKL